MKASRAPTILIVDDDFVCRDITLQILEHELEALALRFLQAVNGKEALELARANKPDLILMDIAMPVLSGSGAIPLLKADPATRDIPVVAVTALVVPSESSQLLDIGFDAYLPKPVDYDKLVEVVKSFLQLGGQMQ